MVKPSISKYKPLRKVAGLHHIVSGMAVAAVTSRECGSCKSLRYALYDLYLIAIDKSNLNHLPCSNHPKGRPGEIYRSCAIVAQWQGIIGNGWTDVSPPLRPYFLAK